MKEIAGPEQENAQALFCLKGIEEAALSLAVTGMTEREMAEELGIAQSSVRWRLAGARRKLGARNTVQAAAIAVAAGLIKVDLDRGNDGC